MRLYALAGIYGVTLHQFGFSVLSYQYWILTLLTAAISVAFYFHHVED